ncbi:hypothetical protein AXG93_2402s1110 [Marchantia polymorpha subsp. ruderalis]|uniref:S1 motif domain-containing protein n=1 Tax=Marchantia polymorpha subsp. ruderalis TaxID=1480154 RepID=A0A176VUF8_MARPO|nr:hypothetical protein AXG93_2402s1110 [Marchantia polymorpha subsp. ruderalis]
MWPTAASATCSLSRTLSLGQIGSSCKSVSGIGGLSSSSGDVSMLASSSSSLNSSSGLASFGVGQVRDSRASKKRFLKCKALKIEGPPPRIEPVASASSEKAAEADKTTPAVDGAAVPSPSTAESQEAKIARRAADWRRVEKLKETGTLHKGRVDACNSGGILVRINGLQSFLPFSQLNSARLTKDGVTRTSAEVGKELVGELITVKVIECNEEERRLIVSEKQAVLVESVQQIKEGDVYEGKVNSVTEYGAFVDLKFPDGSYPVSGLVHVSELSWDPVPFPRDFIQEEQIVKVKVVQVDREKLKLALSIKQLQADPLLETLDTLMPVEPLETTPGSDAEMIEIPLPGLEQIVAFMLEEEGITKVTLGRQALERRVVSQDLEIWLSNMHSSEPKKYKAKLDVTEVQEVHLETSLDRDGIKAAVQRVTGRVP